MADYLPEDLMPNVLRRLPIKCLVKFRCVCKSWHILLSNLEFLYRNLHYDHMNENPILFLEEYDEYADHLYLLNNDYGPSDPRAYSFTFSLFSINKSINMFTTPNRFLRPEPRNFYPGPEELNPIEIYSNGLICFCYQIYGCYVIWNPTTGEKKLVPEPEHLLPIDYTSLYRVNGFGFDQKNNDYKIVLQINVADPTTYECIGRQIVIYSLSFDSWRLLDECFPYEMHSTGRYQTYMNGTYYWLGYSSIRSFEQYQQMILSFDFSSEVFAETQLPNEINNECGYTYNKTIFVLKESSIGLVLKTGRDDTTTSFSIWVLLQFGIEDSWIKLFSIPPLEGSLDKPLGFWTNGELVFHNSVNEILIYDPITQISAQEHIDGVSNIWGIVHYKPTRVLLNDF